MSLILCFLILAKASSLFPTFLNWPDHNTVQFEKSDRPDCFFIARGRKKKKEYKSLGGGHKKFSFFLH